ncbi:TetR/AcrR family transcriptional regulator [Phytoactinopolyspora halotolerans]|uniref:TetR/AcrR family transcriptional regulator n=1 Tax=Phytoactinopolyspora halotolerans TaxID=1981512 RepID=A0A6L9RZZ2_9ACTN|nr:TetR/AcrR family transcriptional regulator [Phytoactinopolyspora halotolerans]NED98555.1 TetR/AcrR family transcriptional regulator [Phytoactinopolyspora halotolerans]
MNTESTRAGAAGRGGTRRRLSGDDWARAALTAIGEGGLGAVAVEPLAARLGTTKGSFYWHFANREALIEAALKLWEHEHTESLISRIEADSDPSARLRQLFALVVGYSRNDSIEVALLATADHPLVAPVMRRVTERRVSYVASLFEELAVPPAEARRRALLAVSVYLGHIQFAHAAPDTLPTDPDEWRLHIEEMSDTLLPKPGQTR